MSVRQAVRPINRMQPHNTQTGIGRSIPAPVGGWDAQNALADMPPQNAVILDNWIPRPGYVEMRRGYINHATATVHPVETLIVWRGAANGSDKILACSNANIFDATTAGAIGSSLYSSAVNARWQYINFANDAGAFSIAVNGANTPIAFDGTTVSDLTITGSSGPITLNPTDLIDVMAHKRRNFFIENNSKRVWFLDVNAIQGAAQLLDLGPVFQKGGVLQCMATWSLDGGQGADDFAVFMTTEGEVAIYQGLDPSDASNWALVGVFSLGLPLGRRALLKYGSDLAVLTTDGIVPLSQALKLDRAQDDTVALTAKIQNAFATATRRYADNFGWEGFLYQRGSLALFNVPVAELSRSEQYVQNVQTGSWCRFTGLNAFCWAVANGKPYFGTVDGVCEWDTGPTDLGSSIVGDLQTAFNYFGQRGLGKQFTLLRPIVRTSQDVRPAVEMLVDYKSGVPTAIPTVIEAAGSQWDVSAWDVAAWSASDEIRYGWTSVTGIGYCGSARMRVTQDGNSAILEDGLDNDIVDQFGGSEILIYPITGVSTVIQCIGFDLVFRPGGQL